MRKRRKGEALEKRKRPQKQRRPLWQRLLAASPVIAGSIFLTLLYSNASVFRKLETAALDFRMRAREPTGDSNVAIVTITNEDYQQFFSGKSPLDPIVVNRIIAAIASARPKVIGVALDTSPETFQSITAPPDWPPIVWARSATYSRVHKKYLLSGVLGRSSTSAAYGLLTLKIDSDFAIRRYTRWYETDTGREPSFSWAMLKNSETMRARHQRRQTLEKSS